MRAYCCAALLLAGLLLGCPHQPPRSTIVFHNESDQTIVVLFIATAETLPGMGPNLVADDPILPRETRVFGDLCPGTCSLHWDGDLTDHRSNAIYGIELDPGETWHYWFY